MRELTVHKINPANDRLLVEALDGPGPGNASHNYLISWTERPAYGGVDAGTEIKVGCPIRFQNGPIAEAGVNGVTQEALLAILIDRLEGFQSGPYACRENGEALACLHDALTHLKDRTKTRMERGVEGTHAV